MRTRKKVMIGVLVFIVLFLVIVVVPGFIRGPGVNFYTNVFYRPTIDKDYNLAFSNIDNRLAVYGIQYMGDHGRFNSDGCSAELWHYFSETAHCEKRAMDINFTATNSFKTKWAQTSPQFEQYVEATGWHKVNDTSLYVNQSISTMFNLLKDNPGNYTNGVSYDKNYGKVKCNLSLWYYPVGYGFESSQSCERDVLFFGGLSHG